MRSSYLKTLRKPLGISSILVFIFSFVIYILTADRHASYWDCPEYITSASRLEIGHPPGNPVWMLVMRVVTIPFPPEYHAFVINLFSGLCMALASFFLCRILFVAVRSAIQKNKTLWRLSSGSANFLGIVISIGGALCFSFCDSAWFSAVEAEVYAMSAMLSALSFWIMVLWWFEKNNGKRLRFLILVAYLVGLSLGVHQLNLLNIPVYFIIAIYKKYPARISPALIVSWIVLSLIVIGAILLVLVPGLLSTAAIFELWLVNGLSLPYYSGVIGCLLFIALLLAVGIIVTKRSGFIKIQVALWMLVFIIVGFSSYGIIMIRSASSPFMNEGAPSDIFALKSYISRDQYPSSPLIYGQTPYSRPMYEEQYIDGLPLYRHYLLNKGNPIFIKELPDACLAPRSGFLSHNDSIYNQTILQRNSRGYLLADYTFSHILTPELNMWLPRITSRNLADRSAYSEWIGMTEETMEKVSISETIDSAGNYLPRMNLQGERPEVWSYRPTYWQQFKYFISYQCYYMCLRYLGWNFIGREDNQNDEAANNNYLGIPFIIGVIGVIGLFVYSRRSRRILSVVGLLLFMNSIAIVIYLNQNPGEPRERDYTFLMVYWAFCIFICAGLYFISLGLIKILKKKVALLFSTIASLLPGILMASVNFDDHDRSARYETEFFASSLLDFELPAIIFTFGDNTTFPVWYAYEVLGMGNKHIPVDITYMAVPSYISNLMRQGEKKLETLAEEKDILYGAYVLTKLPSDSESEPEPLSDVLKELYKGRSFPANISTSKVKVPSSPTDTVILNLHDLTGGSSYLSFRHLMLLDLMAAQAESEKPMVLYFPDHLDKNFFKGLEAALKPALFGKIYAPFMTDCECSELLKLSVEREKTKLHNLKVKPHYQDAVMKSMERRYKKSMEEKRELLGD